MASGKPSHDQSRSSSDDEMNVAVPHSAALPSRVVKKPGVCGGSAIIAGTRIPVWGLQRARQSGVDDDQLLERFPSLNQDDLAAAWKYVAVNFAEIAADISENEDA